MSAEKNDRRGKAQRGRWKIWSLILVLAHVLGALTSVKAIMETRTSQGAIAWAISLNTFPLVTLPAYWVFGRSKFQGYVIARQADFIETNAYAQRVAQSFQEQDLIFESDSEEAHLLEKLARLPLTEHNDAELLIDGEATFKAMFESMAAARDYIFVQFFIVKDDAVGRKFRDQLVERARAGVRVYFLYDEIGSHALPSTYLRSLRDAGVEVAAFQSTRGGGNRFQLNFRNHRKILIVDGKEAFVGGHNVGDEYVDGGEFGHWRDTHVRVVGPIVQCIQVTFIEDWHWATDALPEAQWTAEVDLDRQMEALCLPSGPADALETCTLFFIHAINSACERIWIASPYFVPDEQFITALQLAALRGVDVRILLPEEPDHLLVQLSSYSYLEEAESAGVQFFRYKKGFMHQKVVLIDNDHATVGTVNFDNRSFRLNFEITLLFIDQIFAGEIEDMLEKDFLHSRPFMAREYTESSFLFKLAVRVARLMAPLQ